MHPWPLVKKKRLLALFHSISLTSNLKACSVLILNIRASMNVTKSSLFPTAIELPSGDQVMLIFSPEKKGIYTIFLFLLDQKKQSKIK